VFLSFRVPSEGTVPSERTQNNRDLMPNRKKSRKYFQSCGIFFHYEVLKRRSEWRYIHTHTHMHTHTHTHTHTLTHTHSHTHTRTHTPTPTHPHTHTHTHTHTRTHTHLTGFFFFPFWYESRHTCDSNTYEHIIQHTQIHKQTYIPRTMGWLQFVTSLKIQIPFPECSLFSFIGLLYKRGLWF